MSYKLRIILEYFQPKIGRRTRIFILGRKNNILIKKKKIVKLKCFLSFQMFYALIDPKNDVLASFLWSIRV